jgi:hypothetical protein
LKRLRFLSVAIGFGPHVAGRDPSGLIVIALQKISSAIRKVADLPRRLSR